MHLPQALREALEYYLHRIKQPELLRDAQAISLRYRTKSGKGERLLTTGSEAAAYAVSRMPATFGAVSSALEQALISSGCHPETMLDAGAGTGAAAWAADALLDLKSVVCIERENAMRLTGKALMKNGSRVLQDAKWIPFDICSDEFTDDADLVVASYVLNEMTDTEKTKALERLWKATRMLLLIVEPGTPDGFSQLIKIRRTMLQWGAYLAAPCPHGGDCPKIENDWCHFCCRVERSRMHRQLKAGEAPFEDEKFGYMAFSRNECQFRGKRITRHPRINKGFIEMEVCTPDGIILQKLSKKDGETYKLARKMKAGDSLP